MPYYRGDPGLFGFFKKAARFVGKVAKPLGGIASLAAGFIPGGQQVLNLVSSGQQLFRRAAASPLGQAGTLLAEEFVPRATGRRMAGTPGMVAAAVREEYEGEEYDDEEEYDEDYDEEYD